MISAIAGIILAQSGALALPPACPGWTAAPQQTILPARIFDYMNGAGELYLAYGFEELAVRQYTGPDEVRVVCEVYRMPAPGDAFGLFSQDRTGEAVAVGQGGVYAQGLLIAWQGRYFIRVLADRDSADVRDCALSLARKVAQQCGTDGALPEALGWLPQERIEASSVHFFHTHACLNYLSFLATGNILKLSRKTDAVLATYRTDTGKSTALVAGYPDEKACREGWVSFLRAYAPDATLRGGLWVCRLENGHWLAGKRCGNRIAVVLESPARAEAVKLAESLARQASAPVTMKEGKTK